MMMRKERVVPCITVEVTVLMLTAPRRMEEGLDGGRGGKRPKLQLVDS